MTLLGAACAASVAGREPAAAAGEGPLVRIGILPSARSVTLSGDQGWRLLTRGESVLFRASSGENVTVESRDGRLRVLASGGAASQWHDGQVMMTPASGGLAGVNGRRYRGTIRITPRSDGTMLVVNVLPMEQYLRGVVPLEIGPRTEAEYAAVQAQAIAARTYAYAKLRLTARRPYDFAATVDDQVYGGATAERPISDRAVRATRGQVLRYQGRIAEAPYSAVCGGSTAAQPEVWIHKGEEPYLRPVSDRIAGSDGYYCDIAPRFAWERTYSTSELVTVLEKYLREYSAVTTGSVGFPRLIAIENRTASNRVGALAIVTDRGRHVLRGNEIRFVLRNHGGEILNSTYFSVESEVGRDGRLSRVTFTGRGNGHGIGMCQWGAIGRARAGQDYRTILRTYYPGTTIGRAP